MKNQLYTKCFLSLFMLCTFISHTYSFDDAIVDFNNLNIEIIVTESTCDNSDGEIEMNVSGGVAPYTITPNNFTNLSSGVYNYTISDSGGCVVDTTVVVIEDNSLTSFVDVVDDINCSGNQTAETLINVAGGSGNYFVAIDGNPSISEISTGIFSTDLSGGSYGITITDLDDNCMLTDNFAVGQPSPIIISVDITEIDSCSGRILNLDISGSGGTPPYDIDVNPMSGGVLVTVIDNDGCSEELFVTNPPLENALVFDQIQIFPSEFNEDNGSIDITIAGGNPPYVYQWRDADNNVLTTDEDIEDLAPGIYFVNISDSKGCTITSGELMVDQTTSSFELSDNDFEIYPNPSRLNFIFINGADLSNKSYQVLNAEGRLIVKGKLDLNQKKIDLPSDLQSGFYYIKIVSDQNIYEVHRFVKV